MDDMLKILETITLRCFCIKTIALILSGFLYLHMNIGNYIYNSRIQKCHEQNRKCKNCKYWSKDNGEYAYNENFGYCECEKMVYRQEVHKPIYEMQEKDYNRYHLVYDDSEGLAAELRVHKEFGCIDFKRKDSKRKR